MGSGWASSLTEAGPRLSLSTIARRLGSASAWKTRSSAAPWLSIRLSVVRRRRQELAHGLHVRYDLAVAQRVHREAGGLGGELDLLGPEVEACLHIGARRGED